MKIVRETSLNEISNYLISLGGGNQDDNINSIDKFSKFYLVEINKEEFFNLVFLSSNEVREIVPEMEDRRLAAVANRAIELINSGKDTELSSNWDLKKIQYKFNKLYCETDQIILKYLLIRDAHGSEMNHDAKWYLQDGAHRALAYALWLITKSDQYCTQIVYCATNQNSKAVTDDSVTE